MSVDPRRLRAANVAGPARASRNSAAGFTNWNRIRILCFVGSRFPFCESGRSAKDTAERLTLARRTNSSAICSGANRRFSLPPSSIWGLMTRRSLLFLSHRLPYPPHNGAALRTYNVIRLLARDFDIHALCFDRADKATSRMPLADRMDAMAQFGRFEVFPIPQQRSRWRFISDHARSVVCG